MRTFLERHGWALLLIFLVSLGKAYYAFGIGLEYRWSGDSTVTFARVLDEAAAEKLTPTGQLWPRVMTDQLGVLKRFPAKRWYQESFDIYLKSVYIETGDITLAYKYLVFPLNLLFMAGAYFLFRHAGLNATLAVLLSAVAAMDIYLPWVAEKMGFGPVWVYTRRYLYTAFVPWILLGYLKYFQDWRALFMVFLGAGLAANLHSSGLLLVLVMLLYWLLCNARQWRAYPTFLAYAALGFVGAFYAMGSIWGRLLSRLGDVLLGLFVSGAVAATLFPALDSGRELIPHYVRFMSYPPREYEDFPRLLVDVWLVLTLAASLLPLLVRRGSERLYSTCLMLASSLCLLFASLEAFKGWVLLAWLLYWAAGDRLYRSRHFEITSGLILVCFWVAVPSLMAWQYLLTQFQGMPLGIEQARALRFLGFLVFLWLACILATFDASIFRARKGLRVATYVTLSLIVLSEVAVTYKKHVRWLQKEEYQREVAVLDLARWAKANLPGDALVFVGSSTFRVEANRRVTHDDKQAQWADAPALVPLKPVVPASALQDGARFKATHALVDASSVSASFEACILKRNGRFALMDLGCAGASVAAGSPGRRP